MGLLFTNHILSSIHSKSRSTKEVGQKQADSALQKKAENSQVIYAFSFLGRNFQYNLLIIGLIKRDNKIIIVIWGVNSLPNGILN